MLRQYGILASLNRGVLVKAEVERCSYDCFYTAHIDSCDCCVESGRGLFRVERSLNRNTICPFLPPVQILRILI